MGGAPVRRPELSDNPFRPGFGAMPPELAGRAMVLEAYEEAFVPGAWSRYRATLLIGHRGIGKTTLLGAMEQTARAAGWSVASVTARPGIMRELIDDRLPRLLREADTAATSTRVTGMGFAGVSLQRSVTEKHAGTPTLRGRIEDFLRLPGIRGLLLSIDELNERSVADLAEIADTVQHGFREDLPVALLGAGLYPDVTALLKQQGITFLHRAATFDVPPLTYDEACDAIRRPVEERGRTISGPALDHAARATQGYPYLTQVIGAEAWDANPDEVEITLDDVQRAHRHIPRLMGDEVIRPTLRGLAKGPLSYLAAMSEDDGPSRARDLERRLDVTSNHLANLRRDLLALRLIHSVAHGVVDFTLPYLREYLREHVRELPGPSIAERRQSFPPPPAIEP